MWSALTRRFLASTSFRLSATYAALLLLSFLVAATGAWFTTRSIAMREAGEVLSVAAVSAGEPPQQVVVPRHAFVDGGDKGWRAGAARFIDEICGGDG